MRNGCGKAVRFGLFGFALALVAGSLIDTIPGARVAAAPRQVAQPVRLLPVVPAPKLTSVNRVSRPLAATAVGGPNQRWAGFVVADKAYTAMSGNWTVPTVSYQPGSGREYSSTWIGIGGNADTDTTLVQVGTSQEVDPSGTPTYYAWYLFYNGLGIGVTELDRTQYPVQAGDKITATIECTASCTPGAEQTWALTLRSSRWSQSWRLAGTKYKSSMASAEWIMEAVTVGGSIRPLPKFTSVTFTDLSVNGAAPNLSVANNALTIVDQGGNPLAAARQPVGNTFTVGQVGVPPSQPLPTQPTPLTCRGGTNFGQMISGVAHPAQGTLQSVGQADLYPFFITQYSRISADALGLRPLKYSFQIVDDLTGNQFDPVQSNFMLSLDPGYYCLKVFNAQSLSATPYNISLAALAAGFVPGATKDRALPVSQMELGNLSHNGYYAQTRYVLWLNNPNNPNPTPPLQLTPGHEYVLRDWIGPATPDQWYRFDLTDTRTIDIRLGNLYLGAIAIIEAADGTFAGVTTYDNASALGPLLTSQSFVGALPAGTYYLHIKFGGVGAFGTTFALSLTPH